LAERWQQWMPHDIDAWQGSANVQALSDLAYRAVHNLLQDMWKQEDCALPVEDKELSKRSRVASRWTDCRDEVLDYFVDRTEGGRITHRVLVRKWHEAREKYEENHRARSEAGKKGAARRWNGNAIAEPSGSHSKTMANDGNNTGTSTGTEQEKLPVLRVPVGIVKFDHSMVSQGVLMELRLSGANLARNVSEVAKAEIEAGADGLKLMERMSESGRQYLKAKSDGKFSFPPGLEKFYGEGLWRDPKLWPWKEGHGPPKTTKTHDPLEEQRREREAALNEKRRLEGNGSESSQSAR
jgi:hypothetical protein